MGVVFFTVYPLLAVHDGGVGGCPKTIAYFQLEIGQQIG